jgi:predicted permease
MNPGFDRDQVVTFTIDPSLSGYSPQQSRAFSKRLLDQVRQMPGMRAASIAARAVMRGTGVKATFGVAGSRIAASDFLNSSLNEVSPEYFETMGMHLVAGRTFHWFDRNTDTLRRVLVNQTFARRFFPNQGPLGRRFGLPGSGDIAKADNEVIGIVSDAKYRSLREPIPPTVYSLANDGFDSAFILHLRTSQHPEAMIAPVRELMRSLSPDLPVIEVRTLREEVEASLWQERLLAWLSTLFGAIAALLTSIGLYGALDYALKSRAREIGLRTALRAQPARIVGLFLRDACLLAINGLVLGLCAYAVAAVWLRHMLYDLRPWEPDAMLLVVVLVGCIAATAAAPAAWRAVRIDPASALRSE